jgi:predicted unusual protein kinase regulating ubiquinone biosynthesis (AarF/ABC1/UbiB family)
MQRWVPTVVRSSLGELNFGRTFNDFMLLLTRRGIAINPSVAIIGKVLSNLDGSVRMIDPDVKPMEVFQGILGDIVRAQLGRDNGQARFLQVANEGYSGTRAGSEQWRSLSSMVTNGQFVFQVHRDDQILRDDRAAARTRALRRTLLGLGTVVWLDRRVTRPGRTA